jgi:hypothetical protein
MSAIEKVDESENRANRNRQVILFAANLSARVAEKVEVKAAFRLEVMHSVETACPFPGTYEEDNRSESHGQF